MLRVRTKVLKRLLILLVCGSLSLWYFVPDIPGLARGSVTSFFQDPTLPSGIQSYLKELRLAATDNTNDKDAPTKHTKTPRILCIILTTKHHLNSNVPVVNATWVLRCHKHFFILNTEQTGYDIINTPFVEKRQSLVHKVRYAFTYLYKYNIDEFDWILKADDDTYVIMENLQYLLSHYDGSQPGYLGFHFALMADNNGFMSGGAGYVISNRALRRLIEFGLMKGACPIIPNSEDPEVSEDLEIGRCLNISGVSVHSSVDSQGRETFHPYPLQQYIISNHLPEYMYERALTLPQLGMGCCSDYSISYHYMSSEAMLLMDHLLYRTSVHGKHERAHRQTDEPAFKIETVDFRDKWERLKNRTSRD